MTFQFGDFYNEQNEIIEIIKWIIGIFIVIVAAVLPFYLAKYQKHKVEYLENINYINFFFGLINNLINNIDKQSNNLIPFINFLEQNDKKHEILIIIDGNHFSLINDLTRKSNFLSIFLKSNNTNRIDYGSTILELLNSISVCEKTFDSLISLIEKYNYEYNSNLSNWNKYAQEFISKYENDVYLDNYQSDIAYSNFKKQFELIHYEFIDNKNTTPDYIYENLIIKTIQISKETNCNIYLHDLLHSKLAYENLKSIEAAYINLFKSTKDVFDNHSLELKETLKNLKSIQIEKKSIWEF